MGKKFSILPHMTYEVEGDKKNGLLVIPCNDDIPDMEKVLYIDSPELAIWEALENGTDSDEIIAIQTALYPGENQIAEDVQEYLHNLVKAGIIIELE